MGVTLLNALEVELLLHARVVGIVDVGLVKPLDEVCRLSVQLTYSRSVKAEVRTYTWNSYSQD
jgi:hypothetical protein